MEENLHKDNLEEFFKKSFDDENIDPSNDQWDVPSDDVWSGINEKIKPAAKPAPPSVFNLKWLMAAAASILILGLVYYNYTLQKQVGDLKELVENQEITIDGLKDQVLTESEGKENGGIENGENNTEFSNSIILNPSVKSTDSQALQDDSQISSNHEDIQNKIPKRQNDGKEKPLNNSQLNNSNAERANEKKEIANENQGDNKFSIVELDDNFKSQGSVSKQENQKDIASNSSDLLQKSIIVLTPLSSKMVFAVTNSPTEEITLDMLPVSEEVFTPKVTSTARIGFYVGAHIAPTYTYRNIKSTNGPVLRRMLNDQEKAIYSVSLGLKAGYQFSKNWSVETGLNYYKNSVESMHRAQIRYQSQIERLNSDGNYDSNYQLKLSTSYGEIETDVALTRSSDVQIDQNDYINLVIKTRQELKNLSVPIAVRYRTAGKKLHFNAKAGFAANFILQKDVTIKAAVVNRHGVQHRRTLVDKKFSGLKNTTVDVLFGIGLDYDISKNMSVYFEPTVTHSLSPVYNLNGKIKTYPIVAALNIGVHYKF